MSTALTGHEYEILDQRGSEIAERLRGKRFGALEVHDVHHRVGYDSDDEPAIYLDLTVSDPAAGQDTWPLEETDSLRRAALDAAKATGPGSVSVYVWLTPETDEPQDDG